MKNFTKKIGIYGGAFDPITKNHILVANDVLKYVDETWITPCYKSMSGKKVSASKHRLNMINIAINRSNNNRIKLCDLEITNQITHAWDTMKLLQSMQPNILFYYIMGMDNANTLPVDMRHVVPYIIVKRKSYEPIEEWFKLQPHILSEKDGRSGSSTEVRRSIKKYGTSNLIDSDVLEYIISNKMYTY